MNGPTVPPAGGGIAAAEAAAPVVPPELAARTWSLSAQERTQVLRKLRFDYFKWDTFACGSCLVLPESLVLSRSAHDEVVRTVERLHGALSRFENRARYDTDALRRLAIPEALHPLITREENATLQLARYDLFPTEDGRWMVSEFNEDVPGGFNESVGLPDLLGDPGAGASWEGDLREHFVNAFRNHESVALLYATAFSEDLQHMLILERWLAEAGHRTVLGSPAHLRRSLRGPRILGHRIDAAFRFYPGEWMPKLPNLDVWLRLGVHLPMMNPVYRLVRQSKTMFALWREDATLGGDDLETVERHCPRTEPFTGAAVPMLIEERESWVLKRAFGRMGDSVVIGALSSEREWSQALADAVRHPVEFCIQEYFAVRPVSFAAGPLYPAVGAFVVNGRFAGYYSRAAPRPLITHQAYHVPTLVQNT